MFTRLKLTFNTIMQSTLRQPRVALGWIVFLLIAVVGLAFCKETRGDALPADPIPSQHLQSTEKSAS